jgi:hypothetical protein
LALSLQIDGVILTESLMSLVKCKMFVSSSTRYKDGPPVGCK